MSCPNCGYCSQCGRSNGHWHNPAIATPVWKWIPPYTNATPVWTWTSPYANAAAPMHTGVTFTYPSTATSTADK